MTSWVAVAALLLLIVDGDDDASSQINPHSYVNSLFFVFLISSCDCIHEPGSYERRRLTSLKKKDGKVVRLRMCGKVMSFSKLNTRIMFLETQHNNDDVEEHSSIIGEDARIIKISSIHTRSSIFIKRVNRPVRTSSRLVWNISIDPDETLSRPNEDDAPRQQLISNIFSTLPLREKNVRYELKFFKWMSEEFHSFVIIFFN